MTWNISRDVHNLSLAGRASTRHMARRIGALQRHLDKKAPRGSSLRSLQCGPHLVSHELHVNRKVQRGNSHNHYCMTLSSLLHDLSFSNGVEEDDTSKGACVQPKEMRFVYDRSSLQTARPSTSRSLKRYCHQKLSPSWRSSFTVSMKAAVR
jgi:hypothetical protein